MLSRTFFFALLLAFLPARAAQTLPTLNVNGQIYTNVTITGFNVTDLYFKHEGGIANARLRLLSPELQDRFNYDSNLAAQVEMEQAAQNASFGEALAKIDMAVMERKKAATAGPPIEAEILDPLNAESVIGRGAPPFKPESWLTDKPETAGKFQMIFIWSSASNACKRALPQLNKIAKMFSKQLVITGVSAESIETLGEHAGPKLEFSSTSDPKGKFAKDLAVTAIPCAVLIDPKGVIRYLGHPDALTEVTLKALFVKFTAKE